jgi:hypothetical protein
MPVTYDLKPRCVAAKELVALIELVQRVDGAIERRKVQLVEARRGVGVGATGWSRICGDVVFEHGLRSGGQSWDGGGIRDRATPMESVPSMPPWRMPADPDWVG